MIFIMTLKKSNTVMAPVTAMEIPNAFLNIPEINCSVVCMAGFFQKKRSGALFF